MDQEYLQAVSNFHQCASASCAKAAEAHDDLREFHESRRDSLDDGDAQKAVHAKQAAFHKGEADRHRALAQAHGDMQRASGAAGPGMQRALGDRMVPDHVRAIFPADNPREQNNNRLILRTGGSSAGVDLAAVDPEFRHLVAFPED